MKFSGGNAEDNLLEISFLTFISISFYKATPAPIAMPVSPHPGNGLIFKLLNFSDKSEFVGQFKVNPPIRFKVLNCGKFLLIRLQTSPIVSM